MTRRAKYQCQELRSYANSWGTCNAVVLGEDECPLQVDHVRRIPVALQLRRLWIESDQPIFLPPTWPGRNG